MRDSYFHLIEAAYARALEGIAQGASRRETRDYIANEYSGLHAEDILTAMDDAIGDARDYGIDKDDIHPSWLLGFGEAS